MSRAGEKLVAAAKEAVAIAKGDDPAAVLHWHGHEYVPEAALRAAEARIAALEGALSLLIGAAWEAANQIGDTYGSSDKPDSRDYVLIAQEEKRLVDAANAAHAALAKTEEGK